MKPSLVSIGFDVSFRTGYSAIMFYPDGSYKQLRGGIISKESTVNDRLRVYDEILNICDPSGIAVSIEMPLPGAGNALYVIESSKRIGELRLLTYQRGIQRYLEIHPSQMRGWVMNARFSGKQPIIDLANEILKGRTDHHIDGDEADATILSMMGAGVFRAVNYTEPYRSRIIGKLLDKPFQVTT